GGCSACLQWTTDADGDGLQRDVQRAARAWGRGQQQRKGRSEQRGFVSLVATKNGSRLVATKNGSRLVSV
ncbi:hypothetical protein Dimus_018821, partial [Dionaea muscipula]